MFEFLNPTTAGISMLAGGIPPVVAIYLLRNERHNSAVVWFQLMMLSGLVWSVSFGVLALLDSSLIRYGVTNVLIVAIPASAIFHFAFCYEFAFKKRAPRAILGLFVPVGVLFVLAWVDPYPYIYTMEEPHLSDEILLPGNEASIRLIFTAVMSYLLVSMGTGMVLGELVATTHRSRKLQAGVILTASVLLGGFALIKILGFVPPYFDPTPIGWTVTGLLFAVAVTRYQFLHLSPAAQDQIIDEITDCILVLAPNNRVIGANAAAVAMFDIEVGMTKQELKRQQPPLGRLFDRPRVDTLEIESGGTTTFFDTDYSTVKQGHSIGSEIIVLREITEQKQAERATAETKEYYQRILEQSLDYTLVVDESNTITDVTPGVEEMSGFSPTEIIGKHAFEAVHPEDQDRVRDSFAAAVENPESVLNTEYRVQLKDGSYHWVEARGRSHIDDLLLEGVVMNVRDISERKQREQELAETAARLTRKNEQLERLALIVSHDLQTPLSTAQKLTQLLRADLAETEPKPEIEQSLQDLETTHERLRAFADHLPRLARESTDVEGPTDCELDRVATAAWGIVDTDGLTLEIESTCRLQADPNRLQRVFENLFQNTVTHAVSAVDAEVDHECDDTSTAHQPATDSQSKTTHSASTATTVRVGTFEDGFYIEDDGPGIRPEQRTELFEYGMGTGTGSGFGLAIVRTIVEAHGWSITLAGHSTKRGARFEIETDS